MCEQLSYGNHCDQFIRIHAPQVSSTLSSKVPVVVVIHGGFWRQQYTVDNALVENFPEFFSSHGWWTVMIEYRRCSENSSGGWPNTNLDILLALELLANTAESDSKYSSLDLNQMVVMGHSAGGTLAMWTCCSKLDEVIAAEPIFSNIRRVYPKLCVPMAPIGNLVEGQRRRISDDGKAVASYMNCFPSVNASSDSSSVPLDSPYRLASPHFLLPMACPSIFVVGRQDYVVPRDLITAVYDSAVESAKAAAASSVQLVDLREGDHYSMVNVSSSDFQQIYEAIAKVMSC